MSQTWRVLALSILLIAATAAFVWAGGKAEQPPNIENVESETIYISPESSPGVQDELTAQPSVSTAERLVVRGFRFTVTNSDGDVVYSREEVLEEPGFFNRLFTSVFWRRKEAVQVPEALTWNGTNNEGQPVAEGEYSYQLEVWDDDGNRTTTDPVSVVVDNTPPSAEVSTPYRIFSPNNDGNQDILVLEQEGSVEPEWQGTFTNAEGETVRSVTWENEAPGNFAWQGRNANDEIVPDGRYRYELAATDRAGNSFTTTLEELEVDTQDTPIGVSINRSHFSPDGDGNGDTLEFTPDVPVRKGIVSWQVRIATVDGGGSAASGGAGGGTSAGGAGGTTGSSGGSSAGSSSQSTAGGREVFSFQSEAEIPSSYRFDGTLRGGETLGEGTYVAEFSVLYENGNNPTATSPQFTLDVTDPRVSVSVDQDIFSPNGDGNKEEITFLQSTSREVSWTGVVTDSEGNEVRRYEWDERPPSTIAWSGHDGAGNEVPNGEYRYTLSSRDRAGNYAEATTRVFRKDARSTPIRLSAATGAFSPNSDGVKDTVELTPQIADPVGLREIVYQVRNGEGALVREVTRNSQPFTFAWNGRNNRGERLPDGRYTVSLQGIYENGNRPTAEAGPITLDTQFPQASVATPYTLFSPDGDGNRDTLPINHRNVSSENEWTARIVNSNGEVVRSFVWSGTPEDFLWQGQDEAGNKVPDGTYTYILESQDAAGNASTFRISDISIDTRPTPIALSISRSAFSPNGDGTADTLDIDIDPEVTDSIVEWRLHIVDENGAIHRRYSGGSNLPEQITFNGRQDNGNMAPEGQYRAEATIRYRNGNEPTASSPSFAIDVTAPRARVRADISLFSPNGDGRRDGVTITQSGSGAEEWVGTFRSADGEVVRRITWRGAPQSSFLWQGNDASGSALPDGTYRYVLEATDAAGNSTSTEPIALEKDTRQRRIALSLQNSYFSPNGDGTKEELTVAARMSPTEDVQVDSHSFRITNSRGETVFQQSLRAGLRDTYVWDGRRTAGGTGRAADGTYTAHLRAEFSNGDVVEQHSDPIVLDTEAPSISLESDYTLFSPDGDGRKDTVQIEQSSSEEERWSGRIIDSDGEVVAERTWDGRADTFTWDGTDRFGNRIADGEYRYEVSATDRAGNSASASLGPIEVDTTATSLFVTFSGNTFAPGVRDDNVQINLYANPNEGIQEWTLRILNSDGESVASFSGSGTGSVPRSLRWNGRSGEYGSSGSSTSGGSIVPNGEYRAEVEALYRKGDLTTAVTSSSLVLDTEGPEFTVDAGPLPFSPDNDGTADTLRIRINQQRELSRVQGWQINIMDPRGNRFHQLSGTGAPSRTITWDGRSGSGELVQAASDYTLVTTLTDSLGNSRTVRTTVPIDVLVIRDGDQLRIRISSITFGPNSPNFTGLNDEQAQQNRETLDRLAEILQRYDQYRIRVEGHANNVTGTQAEEQQTLLPLSRARAETVKEALVERGIQASRMETTGKGGTEPVVPRSNRDEWWKNRRVEFILIDDSRS